MKIFILPLSIFFTYTVIGQNKPNADVALKSLKITVAAINANLAKYKKTVKENVTGESTEGDEIREYFENGKIKKMVADFYGETYHYIEEYYFDDGKLVFFYSKADKYKVPMNVDSNVKIASTQEERYYFQNGNIVAVNLHPAKPVSPADMKSLTIKTVKEASRLMKLK